MGKRLKICQSLIIAGALVLAGGSAVAQDYSHDYGRVETTPDFAYVHNSPVFGGSQGFNCAGAGGTVAYNVNSWFGAAMDLSGCKAFGLDNTYGTGSKVHGKEFTYVFGPRVTLRKSRYQPFFEINFGGEWVAVDCNNGNVGNACGSLTASQLPSLVRGTSVQPYAVIVTVPNLYATGVSDNAFAMTVGGGMDIKLNKRFSIRIVQAEYLYTRFANSCQFAVCSDNNNQNSFRLESGVVLNWGGAK